MNHIPLHVSALFIVLVFGLAFLVFISVYVGCKMLNLPPDRSKKKLYITIFIIFFWLIFTNIIAISGFLLDYSFMPPKLLVIITPAFLTVFALMFSKRFLHVALSLDGFWLIYAQSFRILMEFILWLLFRYQIIPKQMTFEGMNFDILTGITAPLVAYYCYRKNTWSPKVAIAWNVAGLLLLANIVLVAVFSTPYPFRQFMNEPANTIVFHFPFVWLPAFVVPMALLMHLLSLKKLLNN